MDEEQALHNRDLHYKSKLRYQYFLHMPRDPITKTSLFKYIENFTTQKKNKIFR